MAPAPHVIYSEELSNAFQRGHPIANPQPVVYQTVNSDGGVTLSEPTPIRIGDVGYIQPDHGFFVRLFNVHLEPGVDGQPAIDDLPDGFRVLPKNTVTQTQDTTPVFVSQSVKTKNINASASGPFFGGFAGFSASSKRGAILATPDPIESHNAIHISAYKRHAKENFESWHEFAVRRDHDVTLEALILVTGVDLTTSWATAVFSESKLDAGFGLKVEFANVGSDLQLACQFSWQSTFGALVNSGPARMLQSPPSMEQTDVNVTTDAQTSINRGPSGPQPLNRVCNQTVFIRHVRAKPQRPWRGLKLRAAGEKSDSDFDGSNSDGGTWDITAPAAARRQVATNDDVVAMTQPKRVHYHDCLEPVLDYILQMSNARIAIAHDDDLVYINQLPRVVVQNCVGMLAEKQPNVTTSSNRHRGRYGILPPKAKRRFPKLHANPQHLAGSRRPFSPSAGLRHATSLEVFPTNQSVDSDDDFFGYRSDGECSDDEQCCEGSEENLDIEELAPSPYIHYH